MDVTFERDGDVQTLQDIVDVEREGESYRVTDETGGVETVSGRVVGVANVWENYGSAGVYSETCAILLSTDGRLEVPEMPLAEGSDVDDKEWVYDTNFDFDVREMEPRDGTLILRNVNAFALTAATPSDENVNDWTRVNAGDRGYDVDASAPTEYGVSFGSGWGWHPLPGVVERLSMYVDDEEVRRSLYPTAETAENVEWAFEA